MPPQPEPSRDVTPLDLVARIFRTAGFEVELPAGLQPEVLDGFAVATSGAVPMRMYFQVIPALSGSPDATLASLRAARELSGTARALGIVVEGVLPARVEPELAGPAEALIMLRRWALDVIKVTESHELTRDHSGPTASRVYLPRRGRLASGELVDADAFIERWVQSPGGPSLVLAGPGRRTTARHADWRAAARFCERPNTTTTLLYLHRFPEAHAWLWRFVRPIVDRFQESAPAPRGSLIVAGRRGEEPSAGDEIVLRLLPPTRGEVDAWFERHLEKRPLFMRYLAARRACDDFSRLLEILDNLYFVASAIRYVDYSKIKAEGPIEAWIAAVMVAYFRVLQPLLTFSEEARERTDREFDDLALHQLQFGATKQPRWPRDLDLWVRFGWVDDRCRYTNELMLSLFLARKIVREAREGRDIIPQLGTLPRMVHFFLNHLDPELAARTPTPAPVREDADATVLARWRDRAAGAVRRYVGELRDALRAAPAGAAERPEVEPIAAATDRRRAASPRPRVVFFDVMDTLVRDPFYEVMPAFLGMSLSELMRVKHPTAWVDFELGKLDEREFLAIFLPGRSFDVEGLREAVRESFVWLPGVRELLVELHAQAPDVKLYALSNYPTWYAWIEERCGLRGLLAGAFVSYETGVRKPDAEAYLAPCRGLGVRPEDALLVDDREENCAGARAVGMPAVRFDGAAGLRAELARRGLVAP